MESEIKTQVPATHTLAIVGLTLSILGLVGLLPLVGSIGGIVCAHVARREMLDNPHLHSGEGMARASILLGWIGIAVAIVIGLLIAAMVIIVAPTFMGVRP